MDKQRDWKIFIKLGVIILGAFVYLLGIYTSYYVKFSGQIPFRNFDAFLASYPWLIIGFFIVNILFGTYVFYNKSRADMFYFTLLSQIFLSIYLMALTYAGSWLTFPRSVVLINLGVGTIMMYAYNLFAYQVYHQLRGQLKIMVVGPSERALEAVRNFDMMANKRHKVTHVVLENYYDNVLKFSGQVDTVYMTGYIHEAERLRLYEFLMKEHKQVFVSTEFQNLMMVNTNIMSFEDESIIEVSSFNLSTEDAFFKRLMDIVISVILLALAAPIMLVTMLAIRLDSPGPIFYKQERITLNQRPFNILKFRSMSATAERESGPVLAASNDSRVTRVGKFIRATRIDELPQLLNVLLGDMSLVGPRPERPFFVDQFQLQNPYYALRHHVRAGITGYAQVYGKYSTDFNSKLNFDLLYIKKYSLSFDIKLLFQTVKILFDKVSSRGVDPSQMTPPSWAEYEKEITIIK